MIDILVQRNAGDIRGEDVVDPLMCTLEAALSRGRALLDGHTVLPQPVTLTVKFRTGVRLGQLAEVHDSMQGISYRSKIVGVSHKISGGKVLTDLDVVRPEVYF